MLHNFQRCRQSPCPQQGRQFVGTFNREATRNLTIAAQDGLADRRCRQDLIIKHNRKALADIFCRSPRKRACPRAIKLESHRRLTRLLVKARVCLGQIIASHQRTATDENKRLRRLTGLFQKHRARRDTPSSGFCRGDSFIHHLERQTCGLADQTLQLFRIAFTGCLHHDAVDALAGDGGFFGAGFIDPATNNFDRLTDSAARHGHFGLFRQTDFDHIAGGSLDIKVIAPGGSG